MIRAVASPGSVLDPEAPTRERISVLPSDLHPGDQLRDHGVFRTVLRVERPWRLADTLIVVFEPDDPGDTLGVKAHQPLTVWREAAS